MQYQYSNLSYLDFEELAKDIMSIKLNIKLFLTTTGPDGGIDVADNLSNPTKIIQVKHYENTNSYKLISNLKKELVKIDKFEHLNQYYIFTSLALNTKKKEEIFGIFKKYMKSTDNIVDKNDINIMLKDEKYKIVLNNNVKLWLNDKSLEVILTKNNSSIDIDSETFLDLKDGKNLGVFVKTTQFKKAEKILSKENFLFITGNPGVGKTLMTKILAGSFLEKGYSLRTTSNIKHISELKNSIITNLDIKEIIVIDDCLGQSYLKLKESQSNELKFFIKFIQQQKSKKIILNSRITILNEAKRLRQDFELWNEDQEGNFLLLDLSEFSKLEKGKIFYNHLYFSNKENKKSVSAIKEIKNNKNYWTIINHKNFNPRIIQLITRKNNIEKSGYFDFVKTILDNPEDVWKIEYEDNTNDIDHYLLWTIHSLSDYMVSYEFVEKCFNRMIKNNPNSNIKINEFEQAVTRLSNSFVKRIVDASKKITFISVFDPSVNDFLRKYLTKNENLKTYLIENSSSIQQYKRLLNPEEFKNKINDLFIDKSIDNLIFEDEISKIRYICNHLSISFKNIKHYDFYLTFLNDFFVYFENNVYKMNNIDLKIIKNFLSNPEYQSVFNDWIIGNEIILLQFLSLLELDEIIKTTNNFFVNKPFSKELKNKIIKLIEDDIIWAIVTDLDCDDDCLGEHSDVEEEIDNILLESKIFEINDFNYNVNCIFYESENNFGTKDEDYDEAEKIIENFFENL